MILISPWVDTTGTKPDIPAYEKVDPMLSSAALLVDAKAWAGDESLDNWHISPINGNLSGLRNVHLFVGTREMFYPDIVLLYEKLQRFGVTSELCVAPGMNHIYPIYPIPEAAEAVAAIALIVGGR